MGNSNITSGKPDNLLTPTSQIITTPLTNGQRTTQKLETPIGRPCKS